MDDLRAARIGPALRTRLGDWLAKIGGRVALDDLSATYHRDGPDEVTYGVDNIRGVVVVVVGDDVPLVLHNGSLDGDDMTIACRAVNDYSRGLMAGVVDNYQSRAVWAERSAERRAMANAERPWSCEWCDRRYKTERGAVKHERSCFRNPRADQYASGECVATVRDGRVVGWSRIGTPPTAATSTIGG